MTGGTRSIQTYQKDTVYVCALTQSDGHSYLPSSASTFASCIFVLIWSQWQQSTNSLCSGVVFLVNLLCFQCDCRQWTMDYYGLRLWHRRQALAWDDRWQRFRYVLEWHMNIITNNILIVNFLYLIITNNTIFVIVSHHLA